MKCECGSECKSKSIYDVLYCMDQKLAKIELEMHIFKDLLQEFIDEHEDDGK